MRSLLDGRYGTPLIISRRSHPLVKELQRLRDKPSPLRLFLEGPRLLQEALQASLPIELLVMSSAVKNQADLVKSFRATKMFSVSEAVFRSLSDVEEPQGILAIVRHPHWSWEQLCAKKPAPILILDGLQNPGNVAAILRTAEAAGAAGVITTPNTAHLFSPKALRGAMGSALRVPSLEHQPIEMIVSQLARNGYSLIGAALEGKNTHSYLDINWSEPHAVVLGQEGGGLSNAWRPHLQKTVTIPMEAPVESLNVAAAAAVLLYEGVRQRRKG
jgi:TrmH family RNA methyltransferase